MSKILNRVFLKIVFFEIDHYNSEGLNFGTVSISRERLKLETSNMACTLNTGVTNEKKCKIRSKESGRNHVTYF